MKRQYMDFVPAKSTNTPVTHAKRPAAVATIHKTTKISSTTSRAASLDSSARAPMVTRSVSTTSTLGVIEDLSPRTNTPQPYQTIANSSSVASRKSTLKDLKAQKIGSKTPVRRVEKPVENSVDNTAKNFSQQNTKHTFMPPKFINQDKVSKRPLSKNVYRKKIEPAKESSSKKPITIIAKPEKDTKVGLIVAIILTIILGAAAGTVAFLLLPK